MRLFTGIALAPNVVEKLSAVPDLLKPTARINWSPVENLHITCKFIGEWGDDRLAKLESALGDVAMARAIPVTVSQFGFFPNSAHPHSFFADVQAGPELGNLAAAIDQALLPLGCRTESRKYHPHVTLARMKNTSDIGDLRQRIAAMTDCDFGTFEAREFHLYLSAPATRGSVYTKLATYDLMREKNRSE